MPNDAIAGLGQLQAAFQNVGAKNEKFDLLALQQEAARKAQEAKQAFDAIEGEKERRSGEKRASISAGPGNRMAGVAERSQKREFAAGAEMQSRAENDPMLAGSSTANILAPALGGGLVNPAAATQQIFNNAAPETAQRAALYGDQDPGLQKLSAAQLEGMRVLNQEHAYSEELKAELVAKYKENGGMTNIRYNPGAEEAEIINKLISKYDLDGNVSPSYEKRFGMETFTGPLAEQWVDFIGSGGKKMPDGTKVDLKTIHDEYMPEAIEKIQQKSPYKSYDAAKLIAQTYWDKQMTTGSKIYQSADGISIQVPTSSVVASYKPVIAAPANTEKTTK